MQRAMLTAKVELESGVTLMAEAVFRLFHDEPLIDEVLSLEDFNASDFGDGPDAEPEIMVGSDLLHRLSPQERDRLEQKMVDQMYGRSWQATIWDIR